MILNVYTKHVVWRYEENDYIQLWCCCGWETGGYGNREELRSRPARLLAAHYTEVFESRSPLCEIFYVRSFIGLAHLTSYKND